MNRDNAETPQYVFDWFDDWFNFDCDVCASKENTKCACYISKEMHQGTFWGAMNWCNCPFSQTEWWLGAVAFRARAGRSTLMLLNSVLDTAYIQPFIPKMDRIWILSPRIQFTPPKGVKYSSNPKGQIACLFTPWSARMQTGPRIETLHIPRPKDD